MTTFRDKPGKRAQGRGLAGWLAFSASPAFALMALAGAGDAAPSAICAPMQGGPLIDGMTAMYLLMSLFHSAPWLKLVSDHASERALRNPN